MRQEAAAKREKIQKVEEEAQHGHDMPVDDSKIMDQIFGPLPETEQFTGDIEPGAYKARLYSKEHPFSSRVYSHGP